MADIENEANANLPQTLSQGVAPDINKWDKRIKASIKFDENARKQYAIDRRYARGDSESRVTANLLGTYIDITTSFLAAKSPDVSVSPARSVEPPSLEALRDIAEDVVRQKPEIIASTDAVLQATTVMQAPNAPEISQAVIEMQIEQEIQKEYESIRKRYGRRQRDNKVLAESIELVVSLLWDEAKIKRRINQAIRSALTISVGWMKASWQRAGNEVDPTTTTRLHTIEDNIAKVRQLQAELIDTDATYMPEGSDEEAQLKELELQKEALRSPQEQHSSQGFVVDNVSAEDIIVAMGVNICDYLSAPWMAHKIAIAMDDAKAMCPHLKDYWGQATKYYPRKPDMIKNAYTLASDIEAKDAEAFSSSDRGADTDTSECFVMFIEIWDKTSNHMMTYVDGIKSAWATPPSQPMATTRFYPFFLTPFGEIDNERHPQSLVSRTIKLMNEYNRIKSAEATHRERIQPKMIFNAGALAEGEMTKITNAGIAEYIPVNFTNPDMDIRAVFAPVQYPQMDATLYDTAPIIMELERIWGVQEALGGAVSVAKTATEADIQQQGFSSRTDDKREAVEDTLTELAHYTTELAMTNMPLEEVQELIGSDCLWVQITSPEQLKKLCRVGIQAGSTGKPNTQLERQSWATLLPQMTEGIQMIGQLRGSMPTDVADRMEELIRITAERSGEKFDIDALMPQAPQQSPLAPIVGDPMADPNAPTADPLQAPPIDPTATQTPTM